MRQILFLIFINVTSLPAQTHYNKKRFTFYDLYPWQGEKGCSVGINYYNRPSLEVGIFSSDVPKSGNDWILANQLIFLNAEFTVNNKNAVIGPKIGYELNYVLFIGRISNACYYEFDKNIFDNRLLIEGGASLFGHANLCYGYSLPVLNEEIKNIERHRLSLKINFFHNL